MHQGLDLSKFKKVAADAKTTTLRHGKGHEIKIAHSGLTPKFRDALQALPTYKADGGEVEDDQPAAPVTEGGDATPEDTAAAEGPSWGTDTTPASTDAPPQDPAAAATSEPAPDAQAAAPAAPAAGDAIPPKPDVMPSAGEVQVIGYKPPSAQELDMHDQQLGQDMLTGQIKPETYKDLFAKKDTVGKIGTLFGLLLSGAGSGLAHQQNALLGMMDKEIDRDLDAQKASNTNAQNWVRLSQQHALQQVQIPLMKAQADYQAALKTKIPSEIAEAEARVKHINAQAMLAGTETAKNKAQLGIYSTLAAQADKLPNGSSQKAQAQNVLQGQIAPAIAASNQQRNAQTAAALQQNEAAYAAKQQAYRAIGQGAVAESNDSRHLPGIGDASVPVSSADREQITSSQQLMGSLQRLKEFSQKHGNSVDPKVVAQGKALAAQVQGDFRLATHGGVYKEGEQNFINQVVPGDPTAFVPGVRVIPKIDAVLNETQARNNAKLKALGVTGYGDSGSGQASVAQSAPQFQEGATGKTKSGDPVIFKGGKWVPQQKVSKK